MKNNYWYYGVVIMITVVAGIVVASSLTLPDNMKLLVVESGSMEPTIMTGSLVLVKPEKQYKIGDVVSYTTDNQKSITHRIYKVDNGFFVTKGDANDAVDSGMVSANRVEGKAVFWLSYVGVIINFFKNKTATTFLIVIPSGLIVAREIYRLRELLS